MPVACDESAPGADLVHQEAEASTMRPGEQGYDDVPSTLPHDTASEHSSAGTSFSKSAMAGPMKKTTYIMPEPVPTTFEYGKYQADMDGMDDLIGINMFLDVRQYCILTLRTKANRS